MTLTCVYCIIILVTSYHNVNSGRYITTVQCIPNNGISTDIAFKARLKRDEKYFGFEFQEIAFLWLYAELLVNLFKQDVVTRQIIKGIQCYPFYTFDIT